MTEALMPKAQIGEYQIVQELGRGAMGAVYHARHLTLEREKALKVLHQHLAERESSLEAFRLEARVMARLSHPHINPVENFLQLDGHWLLVMDLSPLGSLANLVKQEGGQLPVAQVHAITSQVLQGLGHAHRRNIIHRDIKPSNILLFEDEAGNRIARIADFGLVQAMGEDLLRTRAEQSMRSMHSQDGATL